MQVVRGWSLARLRCACCLRGMETDGWKSLAVGLCFGGSVKSFRGGMWRRVTETDGCSAGLEGISNFETAGLDIGCGSRVGRNGVTGLD